MACDVGHGVLTHNSLDTQACLTAEFSVPLFVTTVKYAARTQLPTVRGVTKITDLSELECVDTAELHLHIVSDKTLITQFCV